jgi:transposase
MATRRKFSAEYKHEAVGLVQSSNQSVSRVAGDLGISPGLLSRWCREAAAEGGKAFPGQGKVRDGEVANLKRELAQTRKERDFLREAAAFFAKASK